MCGFIVSSDMSFVILARVVNFLISFGGIISGGLILYCALKYNVPSISIPQYKHQKINILRIKKRKGTVMLDANQLEKKLEYILSKFNNKNYINSYKRNIKFNFSNKIKNNALAMIINLYDKKNI